MIWIIAGAVLLLALLSRRFRKFGLAIAGAVIVLIVIVIVVNNRDKPSPVPLDSKPRARISNKMPNLDDYLIERQDKEDPDAKNRIPLAEVRFGQIQATFGPQSGAIQSIQARLYNDSKRFSLTDYAYYLVVEDCVPSKPHDGPRCTTVYDQRDRGTRVVIPPNQARDISISIPTNPATFSPLFKILGKPQIELTPTETRAYQSP
jgi:hypothetical protein